MLRIWGFSRFFVAEHHGVPGIAGSAPTVLAAAVAAQTSSIRVGTAGIMLPAHQPVVAAEQIAVLEALFPGRIDAGIGNSVGFTQPVRDALRQGDPAELKAAFPADVAELLTYLRGEAEITARPANVGATPVWLLAGFKSVLTAAQLGVNVIVGGPSLFDLGAQRGDCASGGAKRHPYLERYREIHPAGQAIVSADIAVAETREAARELLMPQIVAGVLSRTTGSFDALNLQASSVRLTARQRARVDESLAMSIFGSPEQVRDELGQLCEFCGVDEVLVTGGMADIAGQRHSEELLAEMMD